MIANGIIEAGWLVALAVVPLLYNVYGSRSYEPEKISVFRTVVTAMAVAWLVKVASRVAARSPVHNDQAGASAAPGSRLAQRLILGAASIIALSLVISATLSISSRVSWAGSYDRVAGAWTQLSYIAFFALVAGHLRSIRQWTRAAVVMTVTGSTVAVYAVLQSLRLDPQWNPPDGDRVYSTLGNPIFMAAYLAMTVMATGWIIRQTLAGSPTDRGRVDLRRSRRVRLVVASLALVVQIAAIVLSQSRGPVVGLAAAVYVIVLLGLARERARSVDKPRTAARLEAAWFATLGMAVIGVAGLIVVALPGSPLASIRDAPIVGRLATALDSESATSQVRLEIWRSVVARLGSDEPIAEPGSAPDSLDAWRPLIGYGPETLRLVTRAYLPPFLEVRNQAPDRAHNETFDVLISEGVIGYAAWLGLVAGILFVGLNGLGMIPTTRARSEATGFLGFGALAGTVLPVIFTGEWALSGVGLPVGMVIGLATFVSIKTRPHSSHNGTPPPAPTFWLSLMILGATIAHIVEIHFGIAVAATRVHFWFIAAVAVALARGSGSADTTAAHWISQEPPDTRRKPGKKDRRRNPGRPTPTAGTADATALGILIAVAAGTLAFSLTADVTGSASIWRVLGDAFSGFENRRGPLQGSFLWLLAWLAIVAWTFLSQPTTRRRASRAASRMLGVAAIVGLGYAAYQASRVANVVRVQRSDPVAAVDGTIAHFDAYVVFVLAAMVASGTALAVAKPRFHKRAGGLSWHSWVAAGLLVATGAVLVVRGNLVPIRADIVATQGVAYSGASVALSLDLLDRAIDLQPDEPIYRLLEALVAQDAARRAGSPDVADSLFSRAEAGIARAIELDPLESDHRAAMGRHLAIRASSTQEPLEQASLLDRAETWYAEAVALRPNSPALLREYAVVLEGLGRGPDADRLEARAAAIEAAA